MDNSDIKVLIVDDDDNNRFCAARNLKRYLGYSNFAQMDDGGTALEYLAAHKDVDVILLDRMMSRMSGVSMLEKMNEDKAYCNIVVIFQTGEVSKEDKQECIDKGSLYLLQKPYDDNDMAQLMVSVAQLIRRLRGIRAALEKIKGEAPLAYTFNDMNGLEEAVAGLASHCPAPEDVYEALYELLFNALEHGSLALGYEAKRGHLKKGDYVQVIESKLKANKKEVQATVEKTPGKLIFTVKDQGKGFDAKAMIPFSTERLREPSGRGLFKARKAFNQIQHLEKGSCVQAELVL